MSKLQIPTVCVQCQKHFMSKKRGSRFCSDICRAQYARDNHSKQFKSQEKVIKSQAKIIDAVLPSEIEICPECEHLINDLTLEDVIRELNGMVREAKDRAVKAGQFTERWSLYVSDSRRFQTLCRMISSGAIR
jgi:hypothetical protein